MAKRSESEIILDALLLSISQTLGQNITRTAREHDAAHEQQQRHVMALQGQIRTLEGKSAAHAAEIDSLRGQLAEVNRVLTNVAGMWTRENHPGLQTEADNRHHDLAAEYDQFRDDEVFSLVIEPPRDGRGLTAAQRAQAYGRLSRELFGSPEPRPGLIRQVIDALGVERTDEEIAKLCYSAADITKRAQQLGRNHHWDFHQGDGRFDPVRQKRYPISASGAPDEIVTLVLAPAYVVGDGSVVRPQVVFTESAAIQRGGDGL